MSESPRSPGKTTIDPGVLVTIAQLTALQVEGVSQMSPVPGTVNRFLRRSHGQGVKIEIADERVHADVYVVLTPGANLREVGRNIQSEIARAISEMVGMDVGAVNIHIEDIDYQPTGIDPDNLPN
jgi:uncharacterized alkaline shock family protein YloU